MKLGHKIMLCFVVAAAGGKPMPTDMPDPSWPIDF